MHFANKKIVQHIPTAQQNAKILTAVKSLLAKNLIKIEGNTIFFYRNIWKDEASAINWMKCLQQYCIMKHQHKSAILMQFKDIQNGELLGTLTNSQAKLLFNNFGNDGVDLPK